MFEPSYREFIHGKAQRESFKSIIALAGNFYEQMHTSRATESEYLRWADLNRHFNEVLRSHVSLTIMESGQSL